MLAAPPDELDGVEHHPFPCSEPQRSGGMAGGEGAVKASKLTRSIAVFMHDLADDKGSRFPELSQRAGGDDDGKSEDLGANVSSRTLNRSV